MRYLSLWLFIGVLVFAKSVWGIDCEMKAERKFEDWSPNRYVRLRDGEWGRLGMNATDWFRTPKSEVTVKSTDPRCIAAATILGTHHSVGDLGVETLLSFDFPFFESGRDAADAALVLEYQKHKDGKYGVVRKQTMPLTIHCEKPFRIKRQGSIAAVETWTDKCDFKARDQSFFDLDGNEMEISFTGRFVDFVLHFDSLTVR